MSIYKKEPIFIKISGILLEFAAARSTFFHKFDRRRAWIRLSTGEGGLRGWGWKNNHR